MPRSDNCHPEDANKPFPTRLRELMQKNGLRQQDLGDKIGKSRQAVSKYADGSSSPDAETIVKMTEVFQVSADYLLGIPSSISATDAEKDAVCKYLGITHETLNALKTLIEWESEALSDVLRSPKTLHLISAISSLHHDCQMALLESKILKSNLSEADITKLRNGFPERTPEENNRRIQSGAFEVSEAALDIADDICDFRRRKDDLDMWLYRDILYDAMLKKEADDGEH